MNESILISLACVVGLGIGAQWLAWRLRLPSILLLLVFGFLAGPVSGLLASETAWLPELIQGWIAHWAHEGIVGDGQRLVDPEQLLGDLLFPVVSLSVAVILFEGGLTLRISELQEIGGTVRDLILLGGLVTWALIAGGAWWILGFELELAVLFGAILVVTGPTVVLPLLRHVQPVGQLRSILKWEGILNDPVGAILAVLVFEALFVGAEGSLTVHAIFGIAATLIVGGIIGSIGALTLLFLLRRYWIPDFLQSAVALSTVMVCFTMSNLLQEESGLFTVTLMGILLANQKSVPVKHIVEFKENLRVLLISSLFILLAARLDFEALEEFDWRGVAFLAFLILVVRPAAVFLTAGRGQLTIPDRIFLSWMAPRGVVAAAVASVFAIKLSDAGYEGAERLVPVTFLVIIGTIAVYGLTAQPLARWIGVARSKPQGVLFVGAHRWARTIAEALKKCGVDVVVVDTNRANIRAAKMAGLRTYFGSALTEYALEEMDLDGIGRLIAVTPNDEANSLAVLHFLEVFGRAEVYQLPSEADKSRDDSPAHFRGRAAFGEGASFQRLADRFFKGATVKVTGLSEDFDYKSLKKLYGDSLVPLFLLGEKGEVRVFTADSPLDPRPGQRVVSIVDEVAGSEGRGESEPAAVEDETRA